eukprot:4559751-Amphidinium_carterae.1
MGSESTMRKTRRLIAGRVASIAEAETIYGAMSEHRHRDQFIVTSSGCTMDTAEEVAHLFCVVCVIV